MSLAANAIRYAAGPGHVESWFLRANHPTRPLALWLKVTVLSPLRGEPCAETWLVLFDGETGRTFAHRDTWPRPAAELLDALTGEALRMGTFDLALGPSGHARGEAGRAQFTLEWEPGPLNDPLCLYPWQGLITGPFPKSKLLTPCPWLTFRGAVSWPGERGERWEIAGWQGMQGHNWGQQHAWEYAWGQCTFDGPEPVMVEGFTGRIKVGPWVTPRMSALVVRRGADTYRFDQLFDPWRQEANIGPRTWSVRLRGRDGEARLEMDATARPLVCLGYPNPDGRISYCFNSKLAGVVLDVRPTRGEPFVCRSEHGGALEFLRNEPEPGLPVV